MTGTILRMALVLLGLATATSPVRAQDDVERLRIHGSNTVGQALVPALVEDWLRMLEYTGIQRVPRSPALLEIRAERDGVPLVVEVAGRGGAAGFDSLVAGDAELVMLTRRPSAREHDAGWQLGDLASPDQEFLLALNGARVVVHRDSPRRKIDLVQLRALLAGDSGDGTRVLLGPAGGGLDGFLRERLTGGRALRPAHALRHRSLGAAAAAAARDPGALALVELGTPLPPGVRALPVSDGGVAVPPDFTGVRSQDYPLAWPYRVYGGQMMSALGRSFAMYTVTPRAQGVVRGLGLVSMDQFAPQPATEAAAAPEAYRDAVAGGVRLPLALRFNLRSLTTIFDGGSVHDLERIAAWLQRPENQGRTVSVVGFAQADRSSKLFALTTSSNRADIVAAWLIERGIPVQRVRGLGPLLPLSAGDSEEARFRNERVELWLL